MKEIKNKLQDEALNAYIIKHIVNNISLKDEATPRAYFLDSTGSPIPAIPYNLEFDRFFILPDSV